MADSTNQMLTALSNKQKSSAKAELSNKSDTEELVFNPQPDMANVLANCFLPDGPESQPQKS